MIPECPQTTRQKKSTNNNCAQIFPKWLLDPVSKILIITLTTKAFSGSNFKVSINFTLGSFNWVTSKKQDMAVITNLVVSRIPKQLGLISDMKRCGFNIGVSTLFLYIKTCEFSHSSKISSRFARIFVKIHKSTIKCMSLLCIHEPGFYMWTCLLFNNFIHHL